MLSCALPQSGKRIRDCDTLTSTPRHSRIGYVAMLH
ncbi:hypothetical protein A2U01_0074633, partial [Trifolium medium]|nr:hypothetical protein [Trifolium medium]